MDGKCTSSGMDDSAVSSNDDSICSVDGEFNGIAEGRASNLDTKSHKIRFGPGDISFSAEELNNLLELSKQSQDGRNGAVTLHNEGVSRALRYLGGLEIRERGVHDIYLFLRRMIFVMEERLNQICKSDRFEGYFLNVHQINLKEREIYRVLDDICVRAHETELGTCKVSDLPSGTYPKLEDGLGVILSGIRNVVEEVYPKLEVGVTGSGGNLLESVMASVVFGTMQRISSQFLAAVAIDTSVCSMKRGPQHPESITEPDSNGMSDFEKTENVFREVFSKWHFYGSQSDVLLEYWRADVTRPTLRFLRNSFLICRNLTLSDRKLVDIVFASIANFVGRISADDCVCCKDINDDLVEFIRGAFSLYSQGLTKFNAEIKERFYDQYQLCILSKDTQSQRKFSLKAQKQVDGAKCCEMSYFKVTELKSDLKTYVRFMEYYTSNCEPIFEAISRVGDLDGNVELVDSFSSLIENVTSYMELSDSILYITKKNPNIEITNLLKHTADTLWRFLLLARRYLPFELLKATFYCIGSDLHYGDAVAQICCFNIICSVDLFEKGHNNELTAVEKMLRLLMDKSRSICNNFITFKPSEGMQSRQFGEAYLAISFEFLSRLFLVNITNRVCEKFGIIDLFAQWCSSEYIYEYLLARLLCEFMVELTRENSQFLEDAEYFLDLLLGLCFSFNPKDRVFANDVFEPLDPRKKNVFGCLKIFLHGDLLTEWLLENVVITYTCSILQKSTDFMGGLIDRDCDSKFTCYFLENEGICNCMSSPIVNECPSISHYLELLLSLPWHCYAPGEATKKSKLFGSILTTLSNFVSFAVAMLQRESKSADSETLFTIFSLAQRVTYALVKTENFGRENHQVVLILKLYSLLGDQNICNENDTKAYLSMIIQGICIFREIIDHVQIKQQLAKLHRGFLSLLISKMPGNISVLLNRELYRNNSTLLTSQFAEFFPQVLKMVRRSGPTLQKFLYNYYIWSFCKSHNLEDPEINKMFIYKTLTTDEEPLEFRLFINLCFILSASLECTASR